MNAQNNSPFPEEREEIIMNFLHNQGSIRIGDVIDILNISPSTARLLLQKMQDKGMLKRTHGGAILIGEETSLRNAPRDFINIGNRDAKLKIAAAAAATVENGDYICLGSGTTTFLMATLLHGIQDLTVVTDSIPIANELLYDETITLYVCGGWILKRNNACRGLTAENFFRDIRVDKVYSGADSIDIELGITSVDFDPRTESAICHSGKQCYILADSTKFKIRPYMDKVIKISDIDYVVTDEGIDKKYVQALENADVKVIIA